jgi:hypothetical protein
MKAAATKIQRYFRPIFGTQAWKVKLGVGSFLTFEFGPQTRSYGHVHGKWHLWIYLSNWALFRGQRQLADSDMDRRVITSAVRRLKDVSLTGIKLDSRTKKTTFLFDDFRLQVSPADYLDEATERDAYWIFFMPDNEVLKMGPSGPQLERKKNSSFSIVQGSQEEGVPPTHFFARKVSLED